MSRFRALAVLAVFAGLLPLGCGSGTQEGPTGGEDGAPPANLVGVWNYQSVTVNGAGEVDVNVQSDSDGPINRMSTFTFTASDDTLTLRQVGGADLVIFTLVK